MAQAFSPITRCTGFVSSLIVLVFMAGFLLLSVQLSSAQSEATSGAATSETSPSLDISQPGSQELRDLLRLLDNPEIRKWLEEGAREAAGPLPATADAGSWRDDLQRLTETMHNRLTVLNALWSNISAAPQMIADAWQSQLSNTETLQTVIYAVIFLFIGAAIEWLYNQYIKYRAMQIEFANPHTLGAKARSMLSLYAYSMGSVLFFAVGSIGAFLGFEWSPLIKGIVLDFLILVLILRIVYATSKALFAPRLPQMRLVPLKRRRASKAHRWVMILAFAAGLSVFISSLFARSFVLMEGTVPSQAALSVAVLLNSILTVLFLAAIWSMASSAQVRPQDQVRRRGLSNHWPTYLSMLAVISFFLWLIDAGGLMGTVLVLGLLLPVMKLTGAWINYLFDLGSRPLSGQSTALVAGLEVVNDATSETVASSMAEEPASHSNLIYRSVCRRIARFVLIILSGLALAWVWGINLFDLSGEKTFSGTLFDILVNTLFAVLLADLTWHWAKSTIDRRLAEYVPPADGHAPGPEARMATLLPLLRIILMVTLMMVVALSILTSLGVNIGPLLAGAGVLGIAVGFGTQALVRDVVSGIFFLIDDAFRIGEYIEIENLRGTVESISIRSLRVRHHRGMVHTIPFGELKSLTNYSRDWVIMKLEFRVPFDTDLALVKKLVKKIGVELQENEIYGKSILQTLKSQGVRRMEEFNMVVGVKFMAKPGEQWLIRRDAYQKVRDAFSANGILFAERNVKVEVLSNQPMDEATRQAVVGAAQNAVERNVPKTPPPDEP